MLNFFRNWLNVIYYLPEKLLLFFMDTQNNFYEKKLNNLQVLRAFAAANVVLAHVIGAAIDYSFPINFFLKIKELKPFGVDIFFVLSGFIMIYILKKNSTNPINFFIDRFFRIVPLYWLLNILLIALVFILPNIFISDIFVIKNNFFPSFFFFSQLVLDLNPILYVGWTLEYEMLFYLTISIFLFINKRFFTWLFVIIFINIFVVISILSPIALEFVIGVILGNIFLHTNKSKILIWFLLCFGVLILIFNACITADPTSQFYNQVVLYGIPSAMIIYGLASIGQIKKGFLTMLGDASYSIYLVQVFSIPGFYKLASLLKISTILSNDFLATLCFLASILCGVATYFVIEKHLLNVSKKIASIIKIS